MPARSPRKHAGPGSAHPTTEAPESSQTPTPAGVGRPYDGPADRLFPVYIPWMIVHHNDFRACTENAWWRSPHCEHISALRVAPADGGIPAVPVALRTQR
ncbi:hypothetical protein IFM12276_39290 [Nocardia sputorum]|uniref:Uncharacterized protein n=1 Tax=Nocardia sputorum TaxID=2984338 RepID=A0ABM8D0R5_9NOCA|nr:hypothetical protein IFM12276_39290 [Nocardia sputorum]